jgi:hypothetical protein
MSLGPVMLDLDGLVLGQEERGVLRDPGVRGAGSARRDTRRLRLRPDPREAIANLLPDGEATGDGAAQSR